MTHMMYVKKLMTRQDDEEKDINNKDRKESKNWKDRMKNEVQ